MYSDFCLKYILLPINVFISLIGGELLTNRPQLLLVGLLQSWYLYSRSGKDSSKFPFFKTLPILIAGLDALNGSMIPNTYFESTCTGSYRTGGLWLSREVFWPKNLYWIIKKKKTVFSPHFFRMRQIGIHKFKIKIKCNSMVVTKRLALA